MKFYSPTLAMMFQITDLQADNEESQRNIQQLKKKTQRLTSELQDTKLHMESQQSRNHDLEKKQRKSVHTPTPNNPTLLFTCFPFQITFFRAAVSAVLVIK